MKKCPYLCLLVLLPICLGAQIPDSKIPDAIGTYFKINRLGPQLLEAALFEHPLEGQTLKIRIEGRRTQMERDVLFAFRSAAAVANLAESDIQLLWVEMDVNLNDFQTVMALAPAECSIQCLIEMASCPQSWWTECMVLK